MGTLRAVLVGPVPTELADRHPRWDVASVIHESVGCCLS
jgi:hypothetical protein